MHPWVQGNNPWRLSGAAAASQYSSAISHDSSVRLLRTIQNSCNVSRKNLALTVGWSVQTKITDVYRLSSYIPHMAGKEHSQNTDKNTWLSLRTQPVETTGSGLDQYSHGVRRRLWAFHVWRFSQHLTRQQQAIPHCGQVVAFRTWRGSWQIKEKMQKSGASRAPGCLGFHYSFHRFGTAVRNQDRF